MSAPWVSVVVNNYNYDRYLGSAIDSALAQSWERTEVVVVDDGSSDDSRRIIAGYGGRIIPVLKDNGGQGSAFNAGFAASRGELVCFLDADDLLQREAVARAVTAITPGVAKVHWRLQVIDERGVGLGRVWPDQRMLEGDVRERAIDEGPIYDAHHLPPTSGNAWTRAFLNHVLPMPTGDWDHGADVYLHALAPIYGRLSARDEVLSSYRAHGANHYWKSPLAPAKVEEYLGRFEAASRALAEHLRRQGVVVDPRQWRERSFNWQWLDRLRRARADLSAKVPAGLPVLLIDDAEWGEPTLLGDHALLPFPARDGRWAGRPADDQHALTELQRARAAGVRFVALWWTARWWLDAYPALRRFLERDAAVLVDGDHVVLYELGATSGAGRP